MADQKNQGGQKKGTQDPNNPEQHQGTTANRDTNPGEGFRADRDIQQDQRNNPDDAGREPTDQTRRQDAGQSGQ